MKNWTLRTCPLYQDLGGGVKKGVNKSGKTIQNNIIRQMCESKYVKGQKDVNSNWLDTIKCKNNKMKE